MGRHESFTGPHATQRLGMAALKHNFYIYQNQIKNNLLYSRYYAEACNELRGLSLWLRAWTTQLRSPKKYRSGGESLATLCII